MVVVRSFTGDVILDLTSIWLKPQVYIAWKFHIVGRLGRIMLSFNRLERAEFVACIGITSCHWYLHLISSEERAKLIHFKWKTCWLVTSNLVRTCRSWFEMESLEMKKNSGDILKPVKTRPQYKRIWKEIWQVSVRRADERQGI